MADLMHVARKEFRGFFASPAAYLFMALFVAACLFVFFWGEAFFARNVADLQPLFSWLPLLLIFLIAALTMRSWSEERRSGTLESLLTSPVSLWQLVLGKFVAALGLLCIALILTLPLPITVSLLGPMDPGPVIGGYVATLFLGAAYIAIGLFTSSRTDNPIVALMVTVLICGLFYLIGSTFITNLTGYQTGQFLQLLGTGSRFKSITRGVLDLRDIYYYVSLTGLFLVLNVYTLEKLRWAGNPPSVSHRRWKTVAVLAAVNLIAGNLWLQPLHSVRADLTENHLYTLSDATTQQLANLQEPLQIRAYFSEKTHPLLAPLVPRLKSLLEEYGVRGGRNVEVKFIDPTRNKEAEEQAARRYGIKPVPFKTASRYESSIVDSYFDVVISYGDDYQKLGFRDLIEVKARGEGKLNVALKNPEYELTRAMNRLVRGYRSGGDTFAAIKKPVVLDAWVSPKDRLPPDLQSFRDDLQAVIDKLQKRSDGQLTVNVQDPDAGNGELAKKLNDEYGFSPLLASLVNPQPFWFHLMLQSGDNQVQVPLPATLDQDSLQKAFDDALKRLVPGALKTIALVAPQGNRYRGSDYSQLVKSLEANARVEHTDLSDGHTPAGTDLLLVMNPRKLSDKALFAIDQFLMRGGRVIMAASPFDINLAQNLTASKKATGLKDWLAHNGIHLKPSLVLDPMSAELPVPRTRNVGGMTFRDVQMMPYPFFADLRNGELNGNHPVTANLQQMIVSWPSPMTVDKDKTGKLKVTRLMTTSNRSWTSDKPTVLPDFQAYPSLGFDDSAKRHSQLVGVALTGEFTSWFADRKSPLLAQADKKGDNKPDKSAKAMPVKADTKKDGKPDAPAASSVIRKSPESARLVVVSSGSFASDTMLNLISRSLGTVYDEPVTFIQNAVDWSLEDPSLLALRGQSRYARTLAPLTRQERIGWEYTNYGLALLGLILIWLWRRQVRASDQRRYRKILAEVA
ncbi:ABC transporter permease [Marinobacter santoriniensis NKSG1]|uniref:ABC transporter permease n=1 Tax=Marinobacter santoriniensis NKSG1 TaxID=1288826 RepID=M7CT59_9GAMM|nr:Gldg family protein [Marinobacter santoriniensis]EMP56324.1 ABC transporter permease [Marinobacter santoriniensis NKSG1]